MAIYLLLGLIRKEIQLVEKPQYNKDHQKVFLVVFVMVMDG